MLAVVLALTDRKSTLHLSGLERFDVAPLEEPVRPPRLRVCVQRWAGLQLLDCSGQPLAQSLSVPVTADSTIGDPVDVRKRQSAQRHGIVEAPECLADLVGELSASD